MVNRYSDFPNPKTQQEHEFLKNLAESPVNANKNTVTDVAKKCFGTFQALFLDPREKILNSAEVLVKEAPGMSSLSDAQHEIDGAVQGLNLLHKEEMDEEKKINIQEALKTVTRYGQTIKDIFLVKEAIKDNPELRKVFADADFMQQFRNLTLIYGKTRTIESGLIQSFIAAWMQPDLQPFLKNFLKEGSVTKTVNLEILKDSEMINQGRLPNSSDSHNKKLTEIYADLMGEVYNHLKSSDVKNFKVLVDDIFNKVIAPNTQVHTDGLFLAFNSEAKDALTQRLIKAEKESVKLENLQGYQPRSEGMYQKAVWEPAIGPEDPIRPLTRTIGFATKDGVKNESSTRLDLTKVFGENLILTIDERKMLSELLVASDIAVRKPNVLKNWNEAQTVPQNVQQILEKFDDDRLPHLKSLSSEKKNLLVNEALRFGFEVNRRLAQDLLSL